MDSMATPPVNKEGTPDSEGKTLSSPVVSDAANSTRKKRKRVKSKIKKDNSLVSISTPLQVSENNTAFKATPERKTDACVKQPEILQLPRKAIKPLVVSHIANVHAFSQLLSPLANFQLKLAGKFVRIIPDTMKDKNVLFNFLKENNYQFYKVPDKDYPLKVVIRGWSADTPTDEIKDALLFRNFDTLKANQMRSFRTSQLLSLFQVHLTNSAKNQEIFKITELFSFSVKVEAYRQPKKAIQCYRCQNFFHISSQCNFLEVCRYCGDQHDSRKCLEIHRALNAPQNLFCTHCHLNHPSSFKGCKKFANKPYLMTTAAKVKPKPKPKKSPVIKNNKLNSDPIFTGSSTNSDIKSIFQLVQEIKAEFGFNPLEEIQNKLSQALKVIKETAEPQEKMKCFFEVFGQFDATTIALLTHFM